MNTESPMLHDRVINCCLILNGQLPNYIVTKTRYFYDDDFFALYSMLDCVAKKISKTTNEGKLYVASPLYTNDNHTIYLHHWISKLLEILG